MSKTDKAVIPQIRTDAQRAEDNAAAARCAAAKRTVRHGDQLFADANGSAVKARVYDIQHKVNGAWRNESPESTPSMQLTIWCMYQKVKRGETPELNGWRLVEVK